MSKLENFLYYIFAFIVSCFVSVVSQVNYFFNGRPDHIPMLGDVVGEEYISINFFYFFVCYSIFIIIHYLSFISLTRFEND